MAEFEPSPPMGAGHCIGRHDKCTKKRLCHIEDPCYQLSCYQEELNQTLPPDEPEAEQMTQDEIAAGLVQVAKAIRDEGKLLRDLIFKLLKEVPDGR